jgi:hypothetical protein
MICNSYDCTIVADNPVSFTNISLQIERVRWAVDLKTGNVRFISILNISPGAILGAMDLDRKGILYGLDTTSNDCAFRQAGL